MPEDYPEFTVDPNAADLIAAAAAMPGVADLMRLYEQQARIIRAAVAYMDQARPQLIITAGAGTTGISG